MTFFQMDEVVSIMNPNDVEDVLEENRFSNVTNSYNLDEWSKENLLELLTHMETELSSLETAFNQLKLTSQREEPHIKYGLTALQGDDQYFEGGLNDCKLKDMKNEFIGLKNNLDMFSLNKTKNYDRMRSMLHLVSHQYKYTCDELSLEKQRWIDFKKQMDRLQHQSHHEKQLLIRQLEQMLESKEGLIGQVERLEREVVAARVHRDGALLLANERTWFCNKISALIAMVTELEGDLEALRVRNSSLDQQLIQFEVMKRSLTDDEKEKENLYREFEARMKAKDDEIIRLRQEVNKLKLNQHVNLSTHTLPGKSPYNSSQPATPRTSKFATSNSTTTPTIPSTSSITPPQNIFSLSPPNQQSTIKRSPQKLQSSLTSPLPAHQHLHRRYPGSQSKIHTDSLYDNIDYASCNNISGLNLKPPNFTNISSSSTSPSSPSALTTSSSTSPSESSSSSSSASSSSTSSSLFSSTSFLPNHNPTMPSSTSLNKTRQEGGEREDRTTRFNIFGAEMADLQDLISAAISKHPSQRPEPQAENTNEDLSSSLSSSPHSSPSSSSFSSSTTIVETDTNGMDSEPLDLSVVQFLIATCHESALKQLLSRSAAHTQQLNDSCKLPNGIHPVHFAVECGADSCLKALLECGGSTDALDTDKMTPLNLAASEGNITCLAHLLRHGGSVHQANHIGMTPLHSAASNGHVDCCLLLLAAGAAVDAVNINSWTALHTATFSDQHHCLLQMLSFSFNQPSRDAEYKESIHKLINMADKDGCTLVHLAIVKDTKDCLECLLAFSGGSLEVERRDRWNRTPLQIASPACHGLLFNHESSKELRCHVTIDLQWENRPSDNFYASDATLPRSANSNHTIKNNSHVFIGSVLISKATEWRQLEEQLSSALLNHVSQVSVGIRTNKISKLEHDLSSPSSLLSSSFSTPPTDTTPNPFTLGLSIKSVKYYSIGRYHWFPGTVTEKSPLEMLSSYETTSLSIKLFGMDDSSLDSLSYDSLIPVFILQNYLRIIQQYRSVVFYGPEETGKTYLVQKLAAYIQTQESNAGGKSIVSINHLDHSCTSEHLLSLLIHKECLLPSKQPPPTHHSCILVLDGLFPLQLQTIFSDVASSLENRGPSHLINLNHGEITGTYYLHPNCYIICTMDTTRSIGLDLSIQQRFKWVHLRGDQEPCRYLLHRHLARRLSHQYVGVMPPPENTVYKAIEWVIMVWQRLNEGIAKLGLVDVTFGPCCFLGCPVQRNKPKDVLRWLVSVWNQSIVPTINQAIMKSSSSVLSSKGVGQEGNEVKVVSTALYVLMQRAIVAGCPLNGAERDRFLACFKRGGEMEFKFKTEKQKPPPNTSQHHANQQLHNEKTQQNNQKQQNHQQLTSKTILSYNKSGRLSPFLEKSPQDSSLISSSSSSSSSLRTITGKSSIHLTPKNDPNKPFSSETSLLNNQTINQPIKQPAIHPTNQSLNHPPNNSKSNKTSNDWLTNLNIFSSKAGNSSNKDNVDNFLLPSDNLVIVKQPTK